MKLTKFLIASLILFSLFSGSGSLFAQENLNVLETGFDAKNNIWQQWTDAANMLQHHLAEQAFVYLDKRDEEIANLKSKEDWIERQGKVKNILMSLVGPFPDKTPLNAKITGTVRKNGFRVEKVLFESMPGYYVTSCLFIPDGIKGKRPAIIQVSGHSYPAFRSPGTQTQIYNLVKKGFIVFAIDPVGQGERLQYWDKGQNKFALGTSPVPSHSYFGNQMLISGISPIRYFTWDGIRAVDYLISRKEVDPERIGIYGCSGGGTQTTFIAAFDERIKAAVPGCYITGYRRLLESIGPQDAEQNIFHGIINGLTHADLLEVRAPKPLLISSTTRDYFSIQGAIETFDEVRTAYRAFGKEENAGQTIDDYGHGLAGNIKAIYAFFQKALDLPGPEGEEKFEGFSPEDLYVTASGQLATSIGGESAFRICEKETAKLVEKLEISRKNVDSHLSGVIEKAAELSGYVPHESSRKPVYRGRYKREGYSIELHAIYGEGNYIIPLLLFIPDASSFTGTVIYLHPEGKSFDAAPGGRIEKLVREGYIVAAPDLIGTGETAKDYFGPMYASCLIGRSIPGIQAGDIGRVITFLKGRKNIRVEKIAGVAFDEMCPAMIHAAAFNKEISSVALFGSLLSYRLLAMNEYYETRPSAGISPKTSFYPGGVTYLNHTVSGALTGYDLPDLTGCIAPRKVALIGSTDHLKKPASGEMVSKELLITAAAFSARNAPANLMIDSEGIVNEVIRWCFKE
jgi:dienelactone hydrolase